MTNRPRVVITGIGICTPLGLNRETFWENLISGHSSIKPFSEETHNDPKVLEIIRTSNVKVASIFLENQITDGSLRLRAEDLGYNTGINEEKQKYRARFRSAEHFTRIAFVASREAIEDSGILNGNDIDYVRRKTGCAIASGFGGISSLEQASMRIERTKTISKVNPPLIVRTCIPSTAASTVSEHFGFHQGNAPSLETACTSGLIDIAYGYDKILLGRAIGYVVGGTGDPSLLTIGGFATIGALSENPDPLTASRPYDRDRDGFVLGDGAAALYLEELQHALERRAHIYAEVLGYGETQDAGHPTQPDETGKFAGLAISEAVQFSGINQTDIQYINSHGTSTQLNDRIESMVYRNVFGEHSKKIPISSTKGATGHMLNATGAVELAIAALVIDRGYVPLTRGCVERDEENGCDLDYVLNQSREVIVDTAMSVNFGFGGKNGVMILRRYIK